MVGFGRDLCRSSSPTPLTKQGHLQQAAQDLVQAGLEYLQRRRLHNLPGQPGPGLRHPQNGERERTLYQEQMRVLEKQKEMHKTTLNQAIKDIAEKKQKIESQQEEIRDLEKQQEEQRIAVHKMSKDLEERDQEIRSQQEQTQALEKEREMQRSAVSKMSKVLEERDWEIKFQEGKIIMLEQHSASQVRNLQMDLGHMKRELEIEREQ